MQVKDHSIKKGDYVFIGYFTSFFWNTVLCYMLYKRDPKINQLEIENCLENKSFLFWETLKKDIKQRGLEFLTANYNHSGFFKVKLKVKYLRRVVSVLVLELSSTKL